jgi:hypothetical protein
MVILQVSHENFEEKEGEKGIRRREKAKEEVKHPCHSILESPLTRRPNNGEDIEKFAPTLQEAKPNDGYLIIRKPSQRIPTELVDNF